MSSFNVICGDALDVLPRLAGKSFDAVLSDPPYGLEFMGAEWDKYRPAEFQRWCSEWASELRRVMVPGAHALVFGGTRTHHRLMVGMEDGGLVIRDCLIWMYGQGFPKSLDVSKAVDTELGADRPRGKPVKRKSSPPSSPSGYNRDGWAPPSDKPATLEGERWRGYGTGLKSAWEPIILSMRANTGGFAKNALRYGVAGINVDGSRVQSADAWTGTEPSEFKGQENAYGGALNERRSGSHGLGRWPANVLLSHHLDCRKVGETKGPNNDVGVETTETVEVYDCVIDCPIAELDRQSGFSVTSHHISRGATRRRMSVYRISPANTETVTVPSFGDSGTAARFFYVAKVDTRERLLDGEVIDHPTMKPVDLCAYLARLLLPPPREYGRPRRILVPFAGVGSEMIGALRAGWDEVVGIERDERYARLARLRCREDAPLLNAESER